MWFGPILAALEPLDVFTSVRHRRLPAAEAIGARRLFTVIV